MSKITCPCCDGAGAIPVHASGPGSHHPETGECLRCPIPDPCQLCGTTGQVDPDEPDVKAFLGNGETE